MEVWLAREPTWSSFHFYSQSMQEVKGRKSNLGKQVASLFARLPIEAKEKFREESVWLQMTSERK